MGFLNEPIDASWALCNIFHLINYQLCSVQGIELAEPFVAPAVPPIRTKAPTMSPSSTSARHSSRFTERFTSPTTKRIVDELLDEVVAHRLTPRDSSAGGQILLMSFECCILRRCTP